MHPKGPLEPLSKALIKKWKATIGGSASSSAGARPRKASNVRPMSTKDKQVAVERCTAKLKASVTTPETVAKVRVLCVRVHVCVLCVRAGVWAWTCVRVCVCVRACVDGWVACVG